MIRVLIAISTLGDGGIASMLKQYVLHIDRSRYHIDFLVYRGQDLSNRAFFEEEGCKVYITDDPRHAYRKARKQIVGLLKEGNYDILHSCNFFNSGFLMKFAYQAGVKGRVVHSHASHSYGSGTFYKLYEKLMRYWICRYGTDLLACSTKAGEYLFEGKTFTFLPNAVDAGKFSFDPEERRKIRSAYGIGENDYLIGTVAMISGVKNQGFILELLKQLPDTYHFLLTGDGDQRKALEETAGKLGVTERFAITGWTREAYRYYSAFDSFILPSFSEGFPVTALEAQANGLPCLLSDVITNEVKVRADVSYLPLQDPEVWLEKLKELKENKRARDNSIVDTRYDIAENIRLLEAFYDTASSH